MSLAILLMVFMAAFAAMFSAESLISTIIGGAVAVGATQYLKNLVGGNGALATFIAFLVSLLVAIAALVISTYMSGGGFSYENLPSLGGQIFTLATVAYNLYTKSVPVAE